MDERFARTLEGDPESDEAWDAIDALRDDGSPEIFDSASAWCVDAEPLKRRRGAAILCQLRRNGQPIFRDETFAILLRMLESEQDPQVLHEVVFALGHIGNAAAAPHLLRFANHPQRDIRYAVACALGSFPDAPDAVAGLLQLCADEDAEVRDWAVFGLGVLGEADSAQIREALLHRLDDEDESVREEATRGLGKRAIDA